MVFGLIALAGSIPMTATAVLSLQSQAENTKGNGLEADWKTEKCHMKCRPSARTPEDRKDLFMNNQIVLRNGAVFAQLSSYEGKPNHPFTGYYVPYPDSNFEGLVSTISNDPPQLNWIFLDTDSLQIKTGLRLEAEVGITGPWGARVCANDEKRILFENWEGFMAVETDEPGLWRLCFDRYNDGLKGKSGGRRMVELELIRVEMD